MGKTLVGVLIDRFGKDIPVLKVDEEHFDTVVEAAISPQFFGWIASLGTGVHITAPAEVKEAIKKFAEALCDVYSK